MISYLLTSSYGLARELAHLTAHMCTHDTALRFVCQRLSNPITRVRIPLFSNLEQAKRIENPSERTLFDQYVSEKLFCASMVNGSHHGAMYEQFMPCDMRHDECYHTRRGFSHGPRVTVKSTDHKASWSTNLRGFVSGVKTNRFTAGPDGKLNGYMGDFHGICHGPGMFGLQWRSVDVASKTVRP